MCLSNIMFDPHASEQHAFWDNCGLSNEVQSTSDLAISDIINLFTKSSLDFDLAWLQIFAREQRTENKYNTATLFWLLVNSINLMLKLKGLKSTD